MAPVVAAAATLVDADFARIVDQFKAPRVFVEWVRAREALNTAVDTYRAAIARKPDAKETP